MRDEILGEIKQAVKDRAEKTGLDLVLNSGEEVFFSRQPAVLFAREEFDFTDEIIETLNRPLAKD